MDNSQLGLPLYLNQAVVFDLLAIFENGLSIARHVTTTSGRIASGDASISGEIGSKNIFGFLPMRVAGSGSASLSGSVAKEVGEERVHTPVSLHSRLRETLRKNKLLININDDSDWKRVLPGSFVECSSELRINPLLEALQAIKGLGEVMQTFAGVNLEGKDKKSLYDSAKDIKEIVKICDKMSSQIEGGGEIDILGVGAGKEMSVLMSARKEFFYGQSEVSLDNSRYTVFGKILQIYPIGSEPINLLRKTIYRSLSASAMGQLGEAINKVSREGSIKLPEVITAAEPPVAVMLPIAISV